MAIATGFSYLAAILDAWSRRVISYGLGRRIDTRIALAALYAAIETCRPPPGCIHHSDRGTQYASEAYRKVLKNQRLIGSMGRRGNPYDNAQEESFMKTLAPIWLMTVGKCDKAAPSVGGFDRESGVTDCRFSPKSEF